MARTQPWYIGTVKWQFSRRTIEEASRPSDIPRSTKLWYTLLQERKMEERLIFSITGTVIVSLEHSHIGVETSRPKDKLCASINDFQSEDDGFAGSQRPRGGNWIPYECSSLLRRVGGGNHEDMNEMAAENKGRRKQEERRTQQATWYSYEAAIQPKCFTCGRFNKLIFTAKPDCANCNRPSLVRFRIYNDTW